MAVQSSINLRLLKIRLSLNAGDICVYDVVRHQIAIEFNKPTYRFFKEDWFFSLKYLIKFASCSSSRSPCSISLNACSSAADTPDVELSFTFQDAFEGPTDLSATDTADRAAEDRTLLASLEVLLRLLRLLRLLALLFMLMLKARCGRLTAVSTRARDEA